MHCFKLTTAPKRKKSNNNKLEEMIEDIVSNVTDIKSIKEGVEDLNLWLDDLKSIKEMLVKVLSATSNTKVPVALDPLFRDAFKCTICAIVPIQPPLIVSKCCKSILGCQSCIDTWFSGENACSKSCPKCRAERGYAETMRLNGFDELLTQLKNIMSSDTD